MLSRTLKASLAFSPVACVFLAAALSADGVSTAKAQQAAPNPRAANFHCTGSITYTPTGGTPQSYPIDVILDVGEEFVDDYSTPIRAHIFTLGAVQDANALVFTMNYFSDVSALAWVDLTTELTMKAGQRSARTSGSHRYGHSAVGSYTVSYALECTRNFN